MFKDIDLNLLKVFVAVYRQQSITLAADALDMTQPGVSGLLKRLQQKLGVQLFVRQGRGIAPTHQAHELARQVEPALTQIDNALEGLEGFSTAHSRRFVVYASEPVMLMLMPLIEADDSLDKVSIELQPTQLNEEQLLQSLMQQQADLAIDFASYSAPSFFSEYLFDDAICLIAREQHPRICGPLEAEQFYQERHITVKLRREDAYLADYYTEEHLDQRQIAAVCDSLLSQMSMVANSDCIAMTARSLADAFAESMRIQVLPSPFTSLPVRYRLLTHKRMRHSPANMWLRSKLKGYFGQLISP
ncbi:LysR family transcriptional regulator [Aliagarivorans marinus]|uniref:LysR family transcriptional regulator n=1 Tax=Aliagarivorans marinus TaxID=561965 RepID=UPI00041262AC|nr:LysR family transcriptional regulator [Aliagarivorans marinus]